MKLFAPLAVLLLAASALGAAETPATKAPPAMDAKTVTDVASYGIGQQIGDNFKSQGITVNVDLLVQGLKDALQGQQARYTDEQLQTAFEAFNRTVQAAHEQRAAASGEQSKREGQAFLQTNGKKPGVRTTASGLQYEVIKAGQGASPKATDSVRVHYEGKLINGQVFDSSVRRGQPATFRVNQVIPGWTEALQLMHTGDKWRIFVPSELAYGAAGAGDVIGPHSVLVFEVELLGIQ